MTALKTVQSLIDAFDAGAVDFAALKQNIVSYASVNMVHGRLRPAVIDLPKDAPESLDPNRAEQDDRRRQAEAGPAPKGAADPKYLAHLRALHEQEHAYPPFDYRQNFLNALHAIAGITGHLPASAEGFKASYVGALNAIQRTSIHARESVVVSFENPVLATELCREGLITPAPWHIFPPDAQPAITQQVANAFAFIKAVDQELHDAIQQMIGTIACIQREGSSGTVSSMIGLLWLNPTPAWSVLDYAENIVHEFIHNTIFLSDLVHRIFLTPHWYTPADALVVSAIKRYPRGINISYHSVFVAIGLAVVMAKANQPGRALELTAGVRDTLAELEQKSDRFLSPFARGAIERVNTFGAPAE